MPSYHIRSCLPILHSMMGDRDASHLHNIALSLYLFRPEDTMLQFSEVEGAIDRCLSPYKNRFLNEMPEFESDASIEQIGEVLYVRLQETMAAYDLILERFEIEETPLRTYIIRRESSAVS